MASDGRGVAVAVKFVKAAPDVAWSRVPPSEFLVEIMKRPGASRPRHARTRRARSALVVELVP